MCVRVCWEGVVTCKFTGSAFSYIASACPSAGAVHARYKYMPRRGNYFGVLFIYVSFVSGICVCARLSE